MPGLDIPTLRAELAKFLPNERLIRSFEQLGETVDETVDTIVIIRGIAEEAYFLGFAAAAQLSAQPFPDALIALADCPAAADFLLPIPDSSPIPPALASGIYTPTLTNIANIDASTAYSAQWMRLGNVVTVSGKVDIDPTATAATALAMSLPVASSLTAENECAGTAACGTVASQSAEISGDAANDRAILYFVATDALSRSWFFSFTYRVI